MKRIAVTASPNGAVSFLSPFGAVRVAALPAA